MKVSQGDIPASSKKAPKKLSQEDIKAKIAAKFGEKAKPQKAVPKEKVEINSKGVSHSSEENFGDIQGNNPESEVTQEKLKDLLKSGGFHFNDRERKVLGEILK
ncbi:MAG: hypothetical protein CME62_09700 [Halobacteriovoraceae bacterium]|nr:hypothetical protein [Halobacteriovoraceae bacterium]|tara:strand:- start:21267 stop:21578 length:312 start_codon:yes stop_codon:yes gene_type:complete